MAARPLPPLEPDPTRKKADSTRAAKTSRTHAPVEMIRSVFKLKGGTLSAELAIAGPLDKLAITGPVRLANSKLANFDLASKLGALTAFAGKSVSSPDTAIQNASFDAHVAPAGTKADNINFNFPAIGVITGAGRSTLRVHCPSKC